jgi:hypothetical protein
MGSEIRTIKDERTYRNHHYHSFGEGTSGFSNIENGIGSNLANVGRRWLLQRVLLQRELISSTGPSSIPFLFTAGE